MTKTILVLLILSSCLTLKAQKTNLDSLNQIWLDETQPDINRFKALKKIAFNGHLFSKQDSLFKLGTQLLKTAKLKGNRKWEAEGIGIQGRSLMLSGNYSEALNLFYQSLEIQKKIDDKKGLAFSFDNIASIYYYQGNFKESFEYYHKQLTLEEELGNKKGIASCYNSLGSIYKSQRKYKEAIDYFKSSMEIYEKIDNKEGVAINYNNIGSVYLRQQNYEEALTNYEISLKIYSEINNEGGIVFALGNIGNIYFMRDEYDAALENYGKYIEVKIKQGDKRGVIPVYINTANIYMLQGKYEAGIASANKSLQMAQEMGLPDLIMAASRLLTNLYEAQGNGIKALEMHKLYFQITDSIRSKEIREQLQQVKFDKQIFQDSIADAEATRLIEEAHQEEVRRKNQMRNTLISVVGLLLLIAFGVYNRLRYTRKSKAVLQVEKDRSENLLLNILPKEIAEELKEKGRAEARNFDKVSILFTDFKGFTEQSAKLSAAYLVKEINTCFEAFDGIVGKYEVEKIKTIGDAYMAAGGLPIPNENAVKNTVLAALEMQSFIRKHKAEKDEKGEPAFDMRLGIHTGPIVAGIVGVKKFQYDIWGDSVNTASRMESSGAIGKVNISQSTYELIKDDPDFNFECRGKIKAKGKGELMMWFVAKN